MQKSNSFLVHFRRHLSFLDFCTQELEALAEMHKIPIGNLYAQPLKNLAISPLLKCNLGDKSTCKSIMARSVMIKDIIDLISEFKGADNDKWEGLLANV